MMKAAINQTEAVPPFEPKMTRSKFKEVVERGVVIPAWNISPIKKSSDTYKGPQFVDIPLEEEDSSDEEYRPDEEDEDETAEETLLDSDLDSSASSPRGSRLNRPEEDSSSPWQSSRSHSRIGSVLMGPPPPPKALPPKAAPDSSFLEKLHAVEEELDGCIRTYQTLSESQEGASLMAYRTRSKRPLRDVPLDLLEAELRAPDITPDMYDSGSTHQDREWTDWLRGLMTTHIDNEEEGDDEDDPEYNFLAETDEPDVEDYRDDKAVRITKKEVNELMEELFETLKEDLAGQEAEDEGREEEEEHQEETFTLHTHTQEDTHSTGRDLQEQARDGPITGLQTVKQQLVFLRRAEQAQPLQRAHPAETLTLRLQAQQSLRLQQQLQQHVQLLTQTHLLSSPVAKLQSEAETTRHFLVELELLAGRAELLMSSSCPGFCSAFRASNLQGALQLLEELQKNPIGYRPQPRPPDARGYMRSHPSLPPQLAWIFSTRPVFLYPELLPLVSLDPELYCPRRTQAFTAAEDCLLVLGLRNLQGCQDPPRLLSQLLLRKSLLQLRRRLLQCCRPGGPDNMVKAFRYQRVLWPMPVACRPVAPADQRPPVERDEQLLPLWLVRSLPIIHQVVRSFSGMSGGVSQQQRRRCSSSAPYSRFPPGTSYPPRLPPSLDFRRGGFVLRQPLPPPPPQDQPTSDGCSSSISSTSTQLITRHHHTLASLRGRSHTRGWREETVEEQEEQQEQQEQDSDDVITGVEKKEEVGQEEEQQEEASEVFLTLSESSCCSSSSSSSEEEEESESEQEVMSEAEAPAEQEEEQEEDQLFAKDYLLRVCEVLQVQPGLLEQLLQLLDQFVAAGPLEAPELLHQGLTELLQPWPQLLLRFAAFLSPAQARRCGLQWEQQQFQRSRRFLLRVGRSLGKSSALYCQLVSLLQGSPAPSAQDLHQVSSLLEEHADLQQEFWENFQPQQPPAWPRVKGVEPGAPLGANNVLLSASGARVLVWTREADRAILTACQQMGANQKTFRHIATQLGDKTTQQVSLRFQDLMKLFHSSSCSSSSLHKA
ncbi:GON-4-like protein isoform X4 [Nelusetta ayraudi]